jgi:parallel beta-helix repeat protein
VPPGWEQTYPTNNAGMHNLVISNGQPSWADQDFGNLGTATATPTVTPTQSGNGMLSVVKFDDRNGNGLRDEGEPGVADWLMTLYRDGSSLAVQATGPDGTTVFGELDPAGEYAVTEETRDGWTPTTPALVFANFSESLHVTVLIGNRMLPTETPTPTPLPTTSPGSISGSKWHDLDGDHKWDDGEPTLAGWTIYLEQQEKNGSDWLPVGSTLTDANGQYTFAGLAEGHYRVYEVVPPGWEQTYPTNNAGMHNLVISNGQPSWADQDFGNLGTPTPTPTATTTGTTTSTATPTATVTEGQPPTGTATPTPTETATTTATATPSTTAPETPTETATPTITPSVTETLPPTETASPTITPIPTVTEGGPGTTTITPTPTSTETATTTATPTTTAPTPTVTEGAPSTPTVTTASTTPVATTPGPVTPTPTVTGGRPTTVRTTAVPTTHATAPTVRTPDPTATPTPWPTGTFVLPTLPSDMPTPVPGLCPPLVPAPGAETAITGAGRITDPGFYRFASSFEDVNETVWLDVLASNVTIDGNGFALDGRDRTGTHGIRVRNDSVVGNVTIQNLTVTDFAYGISLYNATNSTVTAANVSSNTYDGIMTSGGHDNLIACNVLHQDDDGINLTGTNRTVVINNTVTENFRGSGIHLAGGAHNVSVLANRIGYNDEGLEIEDAADSEISRNLIWFSRYYGFNLTRAENLTVDDNYVRNLVNIRPPTGAFTGTWNLSGVPGPNLLGGPAIGGNFWGDLNATGFSETRRDLNRDGFTDAPYVLPGGAGIDWLPLAPPAGGADRYLLGPSASWRDWLQTFLR